MDEQYDVIVLGTGLKECILSAVLSCEGKKVLHMDRNKYYGAATASLSPIGELFAHFNTQFDESKFGRGRDWNVDLIPKFLMANGKLVKLLVHTGVTRYIEFGSVEGSYVFHKGKIHKVPSNNAEALKTQLAGLLEKRRLAQMLNWVQNVDPEVPDTYSKVFPNLRDCNNRLQTVFDHFNISENVALFVTHSLCLYPDQSYKNVPVLDAIQRMQLYSQSVIRFGKSPYLYPFYGIGDLPQGFARLSAVHGGTYMLDKPFDGFVFENDKVVGVKSEGAVARCDTVICDPSYAEDRVKKADQIVRAICILKHPVRGAENCNSLQIIIPQEEVNRHHDVYVSCVSDQLLVCPQGFYIASVATTVETNKPHSELTSGLTLLEPIDQVFYSVSDLYEPTSDGKVSRIFVSSSYDASTHFESTCDDVISMYEAICGQPFDFSKVQRQLGDDEQ